MNSVNLIGRITKDIELRTTQSGHKCVQFTLAVDKVVNKQKSADFINMVAWDKTAELINQYFRKGSQMGITGRLSTRNYQGKDGKPVYVTEVIVDNLTFCDSKKEEPAEPKTNYNVSSDELPF